MRIPSHLKVGGKVYEVLFPYAFAERNDLQGQSDHGTNKIRITAMTPGNEPRPRSNIEETFIHEILHCVDLVFNANALDEATILRLSEGLYQVLSDNGLLAEGA